MLAAVVPEVKQAIDLLISGDYAAITYIHKFDEALNLLRSRDYDLIVCGVHFNDSSALELLQRVRQIDRHRDTPFVVIQIGREELGLALSGNIELAMHELGGAHYLDFADSTATTFEERKARVVKVLQSLIDVSAALSLSRKTPMQKI